MPCDGDDLVDRGFSAAEQELSETFAQRAAVLDPPDAGGIAIVRPLERRRPSSGRIRHLVGATGLSARIERNQDMLFLVRIDTNVHVALLCPRSDDRHTGGDMSVWRRSHAPVESATRCLE